MHTVLLARDVPLAALVKDLFDRRKVGLTEIVPLDSVLVVERAARGLAPSAVVLVARRVDPLVMEAVRFFGTLTDAADPPLVAAVEETNEEARIAILDAGADSIVSPLNLDALERRVRACRPRPALPRAFDGHGLSLEAEGTSVTVGDRVVHLTAREAQVLRLLVQKRAGIVSRGEMEQHIWGTTRSRTIDVHVARLRQKLGPFGSCIQTVAKVGYRYVESR